MSDVEILQRTIPEAEDKADPNAIFGGENEDDVSLGSDELLVDCDIGRGAKKLEDVETEGKKERDQDESVRHVEEDEDENVADRTA